MTQVADQRADGLIGRFAGGGERGGDVAVVVPHLAAGVELNKSDAAFDESSREQALFAEGFGLLRADAVAFPRRVSFLRNIKRVGRGQLHPGGEFVVFDPSVEARLEGAAALVNLIELGE